MKDTGVILASAAVVGVGVVAFALWRQGQTAPAPAVYAAPAPLPLATARPALPSVTGGSLGGAAKTVGQVAGAALVLEAGGRLTEKVTGSKVLGIAARIAPTVTLPTVLGVKGLKLAGKGIASGAKAVGKGIGKVFGKIF